MKKALLLGALALASTAVHAQTSFKTMGIANAKAPDVATSTAVLKASLNCRKEQRSSFELVSVSLTYVSTDDSEVKKGNFVAVVIVECSAERYER
jgi:hypothetical protein